MILVFKMLSTSFSTARNYKWGFLNSQHTYIHTLTQYTHTLILSDPHSPYILFSHTFSYTHAIHILPLTHIYSHIHTHWQHTHTLSHTNNTAHNTNHSHTHSYTYSLMHSLTYSLSLPHSHTLWGQVLCLCLAVTLCNSFCKCYTIGFLGIH